MIKLVSARYLGDFRLWLEFSDGSAGEFDGRSLLKRQGPLLEPLRDEAYFRRCFIDAGALCWPNGLELSPARLHERVHQLETL
ncbi:MAG: DUF2442 domain-containing protein [Rhodocyclaceae bacterium]|nr:DUF2442 domain-containing protein [Rhodocyclaceae bacterium]